MRATETSALRPLTSGVGRDGASNLAGPRDGVTTLRPEDKRPSTYNAPMAHAHALLIYVRHRGVLNVDEFRRTNAQSERASQTV